MKENENREMEQEETMDETAKRNVAYLPIGSVVLLKDAQKRVMIYGRRMKAKDEDKEYDYMGCVYPEGASTGDEVLLFNQEQISMIHFIGFQDIEELIYRSKILGGE